MVLGKDPAEGAESQHADLAGAEGGVRQAVGFAGSGFLQGDVEIGRRQLMRWPAHCMMLTPVSPLPARGARIGRLQRPSLRRDAEAKLRLWREARRVRATLAESGYH